MSIAPDSSLFARLFRFSLFSGASALFLATPALSNPIEVDAYGSALITQRPTGGLPLAFSGPQIYESIADPNGFGAGVTATSLITSNAVLFGSSAMSAGGYAAASSTSSIEITLTNPYSTPILPNLSSVITPASLGFFVGSSDQCSGANMFSCVETGTGTFSGFRVDPQAGGTELAWSSFTFEVLSEGATVYSLSAAISLFRDTSGALSFVTDLDEAAATLLDFRLLTAADSGTAYVFGWDATPVDIPFPDDVTTLDPGQTRSLIYRVTTESRTAANYVGQAEPPILVAFSGIGDPCCQGGGSRAYLHPADFEFLLPTLNGPDVVLLPSAVPEPASWAMLIAGFGAVGIASRRRRAMA